MRLTSYTAYAIRVLVYLAAYPDRLCSISEMARSYSISQNNLMKVVNDLGKSGYVSSVRGRFGGIRLARPPAEICVGAVIRHTEEGFELVDCDSCIIAPACGLPEVVNEALAAFLVILDRYTIADLLGQQPQLVSLSLKGPALGRARPIVTA